MAFGASFRNVLLFASLLLSYFSSAVFSQTPSLGDFDWLSITPSEALADWTPCYGSKLQCARLNVPIDYDHPDGDKAAIAIIRVPSQYPVNDTNYRGPLFTNPGGPGGSGVEFVLQLGEALSAKYPNFDFVSFDPRGVGASTPQVKFLNTPADRAIFDLNAPDVNVNSTVPALGIANLRAQAQVFGNFAKARDNGIFAHVTTDNAARDLLRMVEASNQTRLQYWGFSYGTVLGATYATLFPNKIERMVLDGVVNTTAYFQGDWAKLLQDNAKALQVFLDTCHDAGAEACPFYAPSTSDMAKKIAEITNAAKEEPYNVNAGNSSFSLADYNLVRTTINEALTGPYPLFQALATILALLDDTPHGGTLEVPAPAAPVSGDTYQCPAKGNGTSNLISGNEFEAQTAIQCGDIGPLVQGPDFTSAKLIDYYEANLPHAASLDEYMMLRVICSGWKISRTGAFHGPVGAKNTSFPILFVGNTADPLTSLDAAIEVAGAFAGSAVLTQDSAGHASINSPSSCTQAHIAQYLVNGTLPASGTVCPVDFGPFASTNSTNSKREALFNGNIFTAIKRKRGHRFPLI